MTLDGRHLRELLEALHVTQGEWLVDVNHQDDPFIFVRLSSEVAGRQAISVLFEADWGTKEDAELIAALHNSAVELLDAAEAADEIDDAYRRASVRADEYEGNWLDAEERCHLLEATLRELTNGVTDALNEDRITGFLCARHADARMVLADDTTTPT